MAGNSRRQGATRRSGSKKGPQAGSGGRRSRGLSGKGPTPRAEDRAGHPAARRAPGKAGKPAPRARAGAAKATEMVTGRNAVVEALRAQVPASTVYVAERIDSDERVREALKRSAATGAALLEVPRAELDRLTGGANHQGIAVQVPAYAYAHPDDLLARADAAATPALVTALDGVTDPRNLGAVLRSTEAFGGHGVLVPERRAAGMSAGAWKASAGAAARTPVARATNLVRALAAYRKAGLMVVGLDAAAGLAVEDLPAATGPLCLVVGSEGRGMSRLVTETCDALVRIPMPGGSESLNAGVAAGIALYEVARMRARHG